MRDKLYRFMQGRNGMDELARMQSWLVLILLLLGMFTRIGLSIRRQRQMCIRDRYVFPGIFKKYIQTL